MMFFILLIVGGLGLIASIAWFVQEQYSRKMSGILIGICVVMIVTSFFTPQGQLYAYKLVASGKNSNWLIVDNSGGETLRHWIIEGGYVQSSDQSDGWMFFDKKGNGPCYVSGDAYVMRINESLEEFRKHYKITYNIPKEQESIK